MTKQAHGPDAPSVTGEARISQATSKICPPPVLRDVLR